MKLPTSNSRSIANTRRWPRFQVHLPVLIAAETADSQVAIPGMVSALSRAGMEVYGGVPLEPGDVMEVEFRTAGPLRVSGIVRNRSGYCFGLEFLRFIALQEDANVVLAAEFSGELSLPDWAVLDMARLGAQNSVIEATPADESLAELFIERHQSFLRAGQKEIDRLRRSALQIRQMRQAMERLLQQRQSGH
jgi:PilZ domain-containing protein